MLRRRIDHDYESRHIYFITITVEGRRPLLGKLVGRGDAPKNTPEEPRIELTELGMRVQEEWMAVTTHHPEITVIALQIMPDHLHGILFVHSQMPQHLGHIIKGFKASTNKHYRRLILGQSPSVSSVPSVPSVSSVPSAPSVSSVPFVATPSQQRKRDRSLDDRHHGLLWSIGYNDHILGGKGELQRWITYVQDNPRRLAIRREHRDYFRVRFNITVAGQTYAAIGNRFLLTYPQRKQIQLSRSLSEEEIKKEIEDNLALARQGTILVSPAISDGESAVMRAALDAHLPLIFLTPWGFNEFSKPGHQYFEACAEGRFLILAPWPHQNRRIPLTRDMCLALNAMAKTICEEP